MLDDLDGMAVDVMQRRTSQEDLARGGNQTAGKNGKPARFEGDERRVSPGAARAAGPDDPSHRMRNCSSLRWP
jgi:hypothetical protein